MAMDFNVDPIYVQDRGLFFDSVKDKSVSSAAAVSMGTRTSFTIEMWIRPEEDWTAGMQLFGLESVRLVKINS